MGFFKDLSFCLKPRCPVCRQGKLFKQHSITVVDTCVMCNTPLGTHDIGDGAAVFMIFLFGFTIVPLAWGLELLFSPPMWAQALIWTCVVLGIIALILPAIKAYLILLEYRHLKPEEK